MSKNNIVLGVELNFAKMQKQLKNIDKNFGTAMSGGKGTSLDNTVKKSEQSISRMTKVLNDFGMAGNSVGGILTKLSGKVLGFVLITSSVIGAIRVFQNYISEIKKLEDATVRMQRVMQGSREEIEANTKVVYSFAKSMNQLAGATYDETINAFEDVVKAGFNMRDSLMLTRTALLATNVTELSTADATRFLIATIRQFSLTATDSLNILDQWNELGKRTGATSQGIADAVSRAGLAYKAAGGTLAQLNAITATIMETTGESGEKIGTSLKTISARYLDVSRGQSLNNELSKIGIRLQKTNTEMNNDFLDVISQLAGKWKTLDDAMKSNIGKAAAGIRQYTRFMSIVENFDSVIKNLLVTIDSQNSALSENEVRAKSLDFKLRQLKGTFQETALNSIGLLNVLKNLVDGFNLLVRPISAIISSRFVSIFLFGSVAVGVLALAMGALKKVLILSSAGFIANVSALKLFTLSNYLAAKGSLTLAVAMRAVAVQRASMLLMFGVKGALVLGLIAISGYFLTAGANARKFKDDLEFASINAVTSIRSANNSTQDLIDSTDILLSAYKRKTTTPEVLKEIEDAFTSRGVTLTDLATKTNKDIKSILAMDITPSRTIEKLRDEMSKTVELTPDLLKTFNDMSNVFKGDTSKGIDALNARTKSLNKELSGLEKVYNDMSLFDKAKGVFGDKFTRDNTANIKIVQDQIAHFNNELNKIPKTKQNNQQVVVGGNMLISGMDTPAERAEHLRNLIKESQMILTDLINSNIKYNETDTLGTKNKIEQLKLEISILNNISATVQKADQLAELMDKLRYSAEQMQKLTTGVYKNFVDALLELKEGQTVLNNIENAMMSVGSIMYDEVKNSIVDGFIDGMKEIEALTIFKEQVRDFGKNLFSGVNDFFNLFNETREVARFVKTKEGIDKIGVRNSADLTAGSIGDNPLLTGDALTKSYRIIGEPTGEFYKVLVDGHEKFIHQSMLDIKGIISKDLSRGLGNLMKVGVVGMGAGGFTASSTGRDAGQGALFGGLLSIAGESMLGGVGGIIGGLLGGLFAGKKGDESDAVKESINYAKQSTKELRNINRNTTVLVEEMRNFSILQESYYFSFSNSANRGLVTI